MKNVCCFSQNYPDEDVPEFRSVVAKFYREGIKLGLIILELIGHALKPEVTAHDSCAPIMCSTLAMQCVFITGPSGLCEEAH